jgi:predicted small lipoprotein YifL
MKRLLQGVLLLALAAALVACGQPRKSVFPPNVTIQQLVVLPNGQWQLTLRIQNNSFTEMDFTTLDGQLQLAELVPVRLHATFKRDIPALAGDVIPLQVLPTVAMAQALRAVAAKGSADALAYQVSGSVTAKPEQESKPRPFKFSGADWLSPVPGIAHTYR